MANVLHPINGFHPRPVSHAPSALGFGFGLSSAASSMSSTGWGSPQPGHTNLAAFHQLASSITQSASSSKSQKRRLDPEDDSDSSRYPTPRDESMDRSPTPERPKRAAPKRARVVNPTNAITKDDGKERKSTEEEEDSVDIGVLLATLPPQSLLPILNGLLKMQPNLRNLILPLIPRPSLEDAIEALRQAIKKLQVAIPYTNSPAYSAHFSFGAPQQPIMRDEYVLGRLRPHVAEFVSTCLSYFPYFSYKYPAAGSPPKQVNNGQPVSSSVHTLQKEKFHPAETFAFLSNLTKLIIDQPSLVLSELEPLILPRLSEEWKLWVENLDRHSNREGNMVAPSMAQTWEIEIERLVDGKAQGISNLMRDVMQHFPIKQNWGGFLARAPSMMIES